MTIKHHLAHLRQVVNCRLYCAMRWEQVADRQRYQWADHEINVHESYLRHRCRSDRWEKRGYGVIGWRAKRVAAGRFISPLREARYLKAKQDNAFSRSKNPVIQMRGSWIVANLGNKSHRLLTALQSCQPS
jgi:hypothetical protein